MLVPFANADPDNASGGEITELDVNGYQQTDNWFTISGHYNLVPSISGLCDMKDISGWVLYTNGSSLPSNLTPGDLTLLEAFVNSGGTDNANSTFDALSNFTLLGQTYIDVPTVYSVNASEGIFIKEGYFNGDGNLIFVIQVESNEIGFGENSFEYQSVLPMKSKLMAPWEMFNNILVQCTKPVCPEQQKERCMTLPEENNDIILSMEEIYIALQPMEFKEDSIYIANQKTSVEYINLDIIGDNITDMLIFNELSAEIAPDSIKKIDFMALGNKPKGAYTDMLKIKSGSIEKIVPITIRIYEESEGNFEVDLKILDDEISSKGDLKYQVTLKKIHGGEDIGNVNIKAILLAVEKQITGQITGAFIAEQEKNNSEISSYMPLPEENINVQQSASIIKTVKLPKDFEEGRYLLHVFVDSGSGNAIPASATFEIIDFNWFQWFLGWPLILLAAIGMLGVKGYSLVSRYFYSKKRYHFNIKTAKLPEKTPNSLFLGTIPGQKEGAFINTDNMTTHTLIAGTTGSGKSITAQVIAEEALLKGIPVLVFDPTKQWSGFLRKCEDKKMLSKYSQFGLRKSKAKAFEGNVYSVRNPRELFNIDQFFKKGEINVLCIDRLKDADIDLFVANTITQFFKSRLQESSSLRLLIVYDEVHRLIPGFGGNSEIGAGFLQLERACREFRKWGIGLMLISQLNTDFIGATKANINTQVQMRTTDETDLKMLEKKFSTELIRSIFKADVGNGILTNPAYNEGQPYFVTFRPILHGTQSLPDEVLDQYQKYNEIFRDLQFKIQKLKEHKKEVFDFDIELNLALKQIRKAKFEVARIYLDGLKPKVDKMFNKLGIKVEQNLINEEEIAKEVEQAKKEREQYTEGLKNKLEAFEKEALELKNGMSSKKGPDAKQMNLTLAKLLSNIKMQKAKPTEKAVKEAKETIADIKEKLSKQGEQDGQNQAKEEKKESS